MIRIKRALPAPEKLIEKGQEELEASKAHYSLDSDTRDPKYLPSDHFKAYKAKGVKTTLNKLFHQKCAYCETKAMASGYFAIEHFRPKAGIKVGTKLTPPGYWWLAAAWDNLFPSCTRCNSTGKGNLFPIDGTRATEPDSRLGAERRLLLHPCLDFPEKHLVFSKEGIIKGTTRKGKISVEVYMLDRTDLTEDRKAWLLTVALQKTRTQEMIMDHYRGDCTDSSLANEIRSLMEMRGDESRYACAARQTTEKAVAQVGKYLECKGTSIKRFIDEHAEPHAAVNPGIRTEEAFDEFMSDLFSG